MRRALFEQPLVVARLTLRPAHRHVVAGVVHQHRKLVVELDHALIVITHTGRVMAEGDIVWRRPTPDTEKGSATSRYGGPPLGKPAPPGWRPTLAEAMSLPRQLPPVDHAGMDEAEQKASRLTYRIGLAALACLLVVACAQLF